MRRGMDWALAAVCAGALTVAGCGFITWTRVSLNDPIEEKDVAFIVTGETTFQQIRSRLGSPSVMTGPHDRMVVKYYYLDAKYFRVNWGWPLRFIIPYPPDLVMSRVGLAADAFTVVFDAKGVAQYHAFTRHKASADYRMWPFGNEPPTE